QGLVILIVSSLMSNAYCRVSARERNHKKLSACTCDWIILFQDEFKRSLDPVTKLKIELPYTSSWSCELTPKSNVK
ncbi:hypothetical protein STEG23_026873, partial [Scotinomys teguina]